MRWKLFDDSDSPCLGFSSPQDALNFVGQVAKNGQDWLSSEYWNFAKGYRQGKLNVVVNCAFTGRSGNYDLVFSRIPDRVRSHNAIGRPNTPGIVKTHILKMESGLDNGSVFGGVAYSIQCPQGRIPSFVRFELSKKRFDVLRHVLALVSDGGVNFSLCVPERKTRSPLLSRSLHDGASAMIQGGSKVLDDLDGVPHNGARKWPSKFDLVNFVASLTVSLRASSVALSLKKNKRSRFQFKDLFICPAETLDGAGKLPGDH